MIASLLFAGLASAAVARAQGTGACRYQPLTAIPVDSAIPDYSADWNTVDSLLTSLAWERRSLVGHRSSSVDLRNLEMIVRGSPIRALEIARIIANYMNGSAGTEYARAAALLYRQLSLPLGPVLWVVTNHQNPPHARSSGLMALNGGNSALWSPDLMLVLACDLSLRVRSRYEPSRSLRDVVDQDEFSLIEQLAPSYITSDRTREGMLRLLGASDPIVLYLESLRQRSIELNREYGPRSRPE